MERNNEEIIGYIYAFDACETVSARETKIKAKENIRKLQ